MTTALFVVAPTVFRDEEYAEPKSVLETHGVDVTTASVTEGPCVGRFGLETTAALSVTDAIDRDWDAVVFIGGGGSAVFFDDPDAHTLARRQVSSGGVLGAICIAPSTLARAGLLNGRRATSFPDREADLIAFGARYTGEPVTVDGRIITANGPESATAFGEALVRALDV